HRLAFAGGRFRRARGRRVAPLDTGRGAQAGGGARNTGDHRGRGCARRGQRDQLPQGGGTHPLRDLAAGGAGPGASRQLGAAVGRGQGAPVNTSVSPVLRSSFGSTASLRGKLWLVMVTTIAVALLTM